MGGEYSPKRESIRGPNTYAYKPQMGEQIGPKWGNKQGPNRGIYRAQMGEHKGQTYVYVGPV